MGKLRPGVGQVLRDLFQRVVDTGDIAACIRTQYSRMGQLAFEHHAKLVGSTVVGKQHGKSAVAADRNGLRAIHVRAGFNDRLTGVLTLGVGDIV